MKITTVMDNRRGEQKSLTAEHGLSFLVETEKSRILFDFGAGKAAYDNACKLNIGMENIKYAVGSHGHYDHAGGYPEFVKEDFDLPGIGSCSGDATLWPQRTRTDGFYICRMRRRA